MQRIALILLAVMYLGLTGIFAQQPASGDLSRIPLFSLPAQDNDALLREELADREPGRAPHFAVSQDVDVRPTTHGAWTEHINGTSSWRLRIQSPTAKSLNFGFTEYWMPRGGELYMYAGGQKGPKIHGPFTAADNEVHNQLWTQVINGDDLVIEVILPTSQKENLRLWLTKVNHDFLGFGANSQISGSCNLDVVCEAADGWGIVDQYRDIIRSVAVYSTGGTKFCTGFLVNNARQDCTPYFMTANHCGIGTGNAPSLVTYWNFENSFCRQPGSAISEGVGDGQLDDFNTGATWRASNPNSDVTIVELDDEVSPTANAFFAGWSREMEEPGDTVIAIHHPSTNEKRISFSFQQTYRTGGSNPSSTPNANGGQIAVPDWDIGTTEGGSSGSPIFDRFRRVRGQLFGGGAACGNNAYDAYGYFFVSWEGGGSPSSRLKDWLDPDNTGVMFIDGREQLTCIVALGVDDPEQINCAPDDATYNLVIGGGFNNDVNLNIVDLPDGLNAVFSTTSAAPNSSVVLTITPDAGISGNFNITISASDGPNNITSTIRLALVPGTPAAPNALSPANGSDDEPVIVNLAWSDVSAESYGYELATDVNFTSLLASGTTENTSFLYPELLDNQNTYYWRVRATNVCGQGEWSATNSFNVLSQVCGAAAVSTDIPVNITPNGTPTVFSVLEVNSTTPISFMTVDIGILHTWVGDLDLILTSPEGTEVVLVDRIGWSGSGAGCRNDNLNLTFSDAANNTNEDLEATCSETPPAANGQYQPQDALAAFNGENPEGTWLLTINDNASADGGSLTGWSIVFCGAGGSNFSLATIGDNPTTCAADGTTVQVQVGPDFGGEITPEVTINEEAVANVTTSFDGSNRVLTLNFVNFATLAPGMYTIGLNVSSSAGNNSLEIPLTIAPSPTVAALVSPANSSTETSEMVTFSWMAATDAEDYTLQISDDETFATIDYSSETSTTSVAVNLIDQNLEGLVYWRVVANNDCGNATSGSRNVTLSPTATHNFSNGRSLNLFPNPVSANLFISMEGNWNGELNARLMSVHGQVLGNWVLPAGGRQRLNVSGLPAGTYLLDMRNGTERAVERVVILH